MRGLNDTHIMSVAYLNIIGDIYVHCRQGSFEGDWEDEFITDSYWNVHTIKKFKQYQNLGKCLLNSEENNIFFDIDLDFFTLNNPLQIGEGSSYYTYLSEKSIKEMLNYDNPLIQ